MSGTHGWPVALDEAEIKALDEALDEEDDTTATGTNHGASASPGTPATTAPLTQYGPDVIVQLVAEGKGFHLPLRLLRSISEPLAALFQSPGLEGQTLCATLVGERAVIVQHALSYALDPPYGQGCAPMNSLVLHSPALVLDVARFASKWILQELLASCESVFMWCARTHANTAVLLSLLEPLCELHMRDALSLCIQRLIVAMDVQELVQRASKPLLAAIVTEYQQLGARALHVKTLMQERDERGWDKMTHHVSMMFAVVDVPEGEDVKQLLKQHSEQHCWPTFKDSRDRSRSRSRSRNRDPE